MYPVLSALNRSCLKDYQIPGTEHVIEKGVQILIPVIGLHHDENYYPEPEKFKPERFSKNGLDDKNQFNRPFLPFGDGPRNCIAWRMAKTQTNTGVALMLKNFSFTLVSEEDRQNNLDFHPKSLTIAPKKGIYLNVTKRTKAN